MKNKKGDKRQQQIENTPSFMPKSGRKKAVAPQQVEADDKAVDEEFKIADERDKRNNKVSGYLSPREDDSKKNHSKNAKSVQFHGHTSP